MQQQSSHRTAIESSTGAPATDEHITLSQAAKLAPGRPSSNCVWRWCREGVKSASGQRVRLKHVRFGSRIYTTQQWLSEFGSALAAADAVHFDRMLDAAADRQVMHRRSASTRRRQRSQSTQAEQARRRHLEAEQALAEAGL